MGRSPHWRVGATRHALNLYVGIVGITAGGRKGTSYNEALQPFRLADPDWAERCLAGGLRTGEGLIHLVRDPRYGNDAANLGGGRTVKVPTVIDEGVTDKRLLVFEPELASVLRVMNGWDGNTLGQVLRIAWDGGVLKSSTKQAPSVATDPHVSLIANITRDELLRELTRTEVAAGFANRFIWVCSQRSKFLPFGGELPPDEAGRHGQDVRDVLAFAAPWARWHSRKRPLRSGHANTVPCPPESPDCSGRSSAERRAQFRRISCLYALQREVNRIEGGHLESALALWRYCEQSARYIFGDKLGDPDADASLSAIRNAGPAGLTRTALNDLFKGHRSSASLNRALLLLGDMGLVRRAEESSRRAAGRTLVHCLGVLKKRKKGNKGQAALGGAGGLIPIFRFIPQSEEAGFRGPREPVLSTPVPQ